ESLQFHANSHELILYDKMADMKKTPVRSIDKLKSNIANLPLKILRYEVRLIKKIKMNAILERLSYSSNPTLQDIFKSRLCKQVLLTYWEDFFGFNIIFSPQNTPLGTLREIATIKPCIKIKKAIYLTGLLQSIKSENGMGGLRSLSQELYPNNNWQKIKSDIDFLNNSLTIKPIKFLVEIKKQLKEFQPINLTDVLL
ncbi:MAG: hypothetical protein U9M94_04575, partial [Patescibacteria group bacterium]|nr:hypothetical protein [Patescibacteria group bacterium]